MTVLFTKYQRAKTQVYLVPFNAGECFYQKLETVVNFSNHSLTHNNTLSHKLKVTGMNDLL